MTVLAAWAAVLGRLSGQDDVVIGIPTANRNRPEVEAADRVLRQYAGAADRLVGRADFVGAAGARTEDVVGAQDHQDLPFEQVVEIVQPPRRLDQHAAIPGDVRVAEQRRRGRCELPGSPWSQRVGHWTG